jgi:hypothetical protein
LIGEVPSSFPRDTSRLGWAGPGCLLPTLHIHTRGITGRRRDAWVSPWCIIYTHLCVCVCVKWSFQIEFSPARRMDT